MRKKFEKYNKRKKKKHFKKVALRIKEHSLKIAKELEGTLADGLEDK